MRVEEGNIGKASKERSMGKFKIKYDKTKPSSFEVFLIMVKGMYSLAK